MRYCILILGEKGLEHILGTQRKPFGHALYRHGRIDMESVGKIAFFGHFGPIFGILTLRGSIFKGFMMMFNGVYMRLPVMMVTLGVSWNIERGPVGLVGARHTPPGHFRPIRITTNSTIFTGKLYSHGKSHKFTYW